VGMTMGAFVMERVVDLVAERLGLDPAEVRRRNLIPREAYPFTSASGMTYDSGDYPKALEQALALADYDGWRREQAKARAQGRLEAGVPSPSAEPRASPPTACARRWRRSRRSCWRRVRPISCSTTPASTSAAWPIAPWDSPTSPGSLTRRRRAAWSTASSPGS